MKSLHVAVCAAALVLGGCSSDTDAPPAAAPTTAATTATPTPEPPIAPASASALVEGEDYDVVGSLPAQIDGARVVWTGADAAGTVYGGIAVPDPDFESDRMGPVGSYAQPVLMDPETGQLTRMTPVRDSGTTTQMLGGDANDDWVTWLESAETNIGMGSWTLYSYERSTKKLRELASHRDDVVREGNFLDYDGRAEIVGDDVVMGTASISRSGRGSAILTVPLDGSAPLSELVSGASESDADESGFSFVQAKKTLMYRDAATGETRQLHAGAGRGECQFYRSKILVTCEKGADGVVVTVKTPDGERRFGPFRGVSYVELRDGWARFVANADGDAHTYAVDAATMTLHHVSASQIGWDLMGHGYALVAQGSADAGWSGHELIKLR